LNIPPRILVVIPAFNEADNLPHVLRELATLDPPPDAAVINDGSSDCTSRAAFEAGATVVVDLPVNAGLFCAVQTGFRHAYRNGYDIVIQVDADGQHDTSGIPALVRPIVEEGVDVVIGSRYLGQVEYRMPILRSVGTRVFGWLTSLAVGQPITDTTCGFRAYGPAAIRLLATDTSYEYRDAVGLVALHRGGFRLKEVPTTIRSRRSGRSSIGLWHTIVYPFHYLLALSVVLLRDPARKE